MRVDRLAAILGGIMVERVSTRALDGLCLWVTQGPDGHVLGLSHRCPDQVLLAAQLRWPDGDAAVTGRSIAVEVPASCKTDAIISLLITEVELPRCGAVAVLAGYVQVLLVHLLRETMQVSPGAQGMIGGLGDDKLAPALVAMHERPSRKWNATQLAALAGMSRSGFMARFSEVVGETPIAYLRQWRMRQAAADLARGERVAKVAQRYGYRSADAFTRAFHIAHGHGPAAWRKAVAEMAKTSAGI